MHNAQNLLNVLASITATISIGLIGANWLVLGVIFNVWLWETAKLAAESNKR